MGSNTKKSRRKHHNKKNKKKPKTNSYNVKKSDGDNVEDADNVEVNTEIDNEEDLQSDAIIKSSKREHDEEDSETEDMPKKKKKKKQSVEIENTNKKGKKSIRQMKREKHAQRQAEAEALAKDTLKDQCIQYLSQWKHDRANWKFMKAKQIWLFKNKFSLNLISDDIWPTLLKYFESAQGNVKKMLLTDATNIIKEMDQWAENQNSGSNENPENATTDKPDETSYKRARDIIQNLEE